MYQPQDLSANRPSVHMQMANDNSAKVEVRKDGSTVATVKYSEGAGMSVEVGSSFDSCVRVWFDRMSDTGVLYSEGRHIGRIRSGIRLAVRKASEAAMWEAKAGTVSSLTDGREDGVPFVEVCDNE